MVVPVRPVQEAVAAGDLAPLDVDAADADGLLTEPANAFCRNTSGKELSGAPYDMISYMISLLLVCYDIICDIIYDFLL